MTTSTATTPTSTDADAALKAKHRGMWGLGDYPAVAVDLIPDLGRVLVDACAVGAGQRVLDVAAGTGNAAIPAVRAGADVVAADLTPELLEAGARLAEQALTAAERERLNWREADAEALPFEDASFDTVLSCVGVMFAPHHQRSADEMLRVCRPGGSIGLLSWTPGGFIGRLFATMKPYMAPPPAGVQPPPLWGSVEHVQELLGDGVGELSAHTATVRVDRFADGAAFRDYFKAAYGPTIAAYRGLADDAERTADLDREMAELADRHTVDGSMDWEYLLVTARRR
ncbi:MAG: class I SAM-dependent methyltransferase [Ornithinimicrobium sp.]|uniref:class I SAM-dependent methyltransferase n=1 Tax=Ornithinimicrobium sp. TaxID=1977084 RepID=UPI003D9B2147